MQRNAEALKRNNEARKGFLIARSKLRRFPVPEVQTTCDFHQGSRPGVDFGPNFAARMAGRWLSKRTRLLSIIVESIFHYGTGAVDSVSCCQNCGLSIEKDGTRQVAGNLARSR